MATLVLSTVGTALGGPVGAAIGALIGQSFDQQLLGPRTRGPRLGDLSVQTSSYGTQIPRIYGRMRAAGTVLWSTDLSESAETAGAKGQPDTVFSYAVSFAVAVSARPIADVGRIWADGKLIRDADGVLKVPGTLRIHAGGEDQALDPLIASAEGIAATPAYRGLALVVFEDLELAEFGNRIPFLTFEVIADDGPIPIGAILDDASGGVIVSDETREIVGYAVHGLSIRAAIEPLVDAFGLELAEYDARLATPAAELVEVDADTELGADADGLAPRYERSQVPAGDLPTVVRVDYYEPARDYQVGEARASGGDQAGKAQQLELPAVLQADDAKALAGDLLARTWRERDRLTIRLPTRYLGVGPGARLTLPLHPSIWTVASATLDGFACALTLRPAAMPRQNASLAADAGRMLQAPQVYGEMSIVLFEVSSDTSHEPVVLLAASSPDPGWRSAVVEIDAGPHKFVERTASRKSVLGRTVTRLDADGDAVEVQLIDPDQWLLSCDAAALRDGGNLAILGGEQIQFGWAEPLGSGRFALGQLARNRPGQGRRHEPGAVFVLLERDAVRPINLPWWITPPEITATVRGRSGARGSSARLMLSRGGARAD